VLSDDTGNIRITWFGQTYLARTLKPGVRIAVSGKVEAFNNRLGFQSPMHDILKPGQPAVNTGRILPVYPLTDGLKIHTMRGLTKQALEGWLGGIEEYLPPALLARTGLMALPEAIRQAHYPDDLGKWASARRRLAFDELLTLQLSVLARRQRDNQLVEGVPVDAGADLVDGFIASLPFSLTGAQKQCLEEILADLRRGTPPMNRLLQGEVGSGKTVVVLVALLATIAAGYQGAIMVPTEVLAEQHFRTISGLLGGLARPVQDGNRVTAYLEALGRPVSVGLLTGSTRQRARRELTELAVGGQLDLLVGTQALIQSGVEMPQLALAVMDEQHRFGVMQRSALRQKGVENPHTLVMSATPIPRTLSLTLYGDLDISIIDELPPGRQTIKTTWLGPERRDAAHGFVRRQVRDGRQAFVIYPLVEESDQVDAKAAVEDHRRLSEEVFPDLRVGLLHGRMPPKDKDKVMRQFRDGELDVLVSTAVVEVGIDVPNATVMLVEGADRFGLSQLHQFRGRVGRGEHQSYCILLCDNPSTVAKERLSALEQIDDGFRLAEVDLELRGPGDFFGTRQSGLPDLRMASLSDRDLLNAARREASQLMESDPELTAPEHAALSRQVARFLDHASGEVS
jgi:ATP-dependent DNA helicase RecG